MHTTRVKLTRVVESEEARVLFEGERADTGATVQFHLRRDGSSHVDNLETAVARENVVFVDIPIG